MATQPTAGIATTSIAQSLSRATQREQRPDKGWRVGETLSAYLFLAPYLIVLGVFTIFDWLYNATVCWLTLLSAPLPAARRCHK